MQPSKSKSGGSYELFDLTNEDDDHNPPLDGLSTTAKSESHADVIDLVEKVPKSRTPVQVVVEIPVVQPAPASSSASYSSSIEKTKRWLDRFVSSKRTYVNPSETAPELEVSNDDYLREFSTSFIAETEKTSYTADELEFELDPMPLSDILSTSVLDLLDNDEDAEEQPQQSTATINLYNLPYTCSVEEVSLFVEQSGGKIKNIEMGSDDGKKKNLKAGSAAVTIEDVAVQDVLASINKRKINGRLIRAQRVGRNAQDTRRRSSLNKDSGRYFVGDDISFKCNACGQVGHKAADCTNDPLPIPCHLCAGADHEPADCTNIICYRCGQFGHHSRDCRTSGGGARAMICFQCGANDHSYLLCPEVLGAKPVSLYDSLVRGPQVQCIDCRKNGHVTCRPIKAAKSNDSEGGAVYCYNCGEEGHHVDFPSLFTAADDEEEEDESPPCRHHHSSERKAKKNDKKNKGGKKKSARSGVCLAPRCEAFFRFPQLQKDYEFLEDDEKEDYYRSLIRHYNDRAMFPVLQDPPTANRGSRNNKQNKRYRDEEDDDYEYYERDDDDDQRWSRHDNYHGNEYDDSHHHKKQRGHSDNNFLSSSSGGGGGGGRFKQMNCTASSSNSSNHRRFSDGGGGSSTGQKRERDVEPDRNWKKFQEQQQQQRGYGDVDFERKKKQRQGRFRNDLNRDD